MVRCGSLYDQMHLSQKIKDNKTGMTCEEQLLAIYEQVRHLTARKDEVYQALLHEMEKQQIVGKKQPFPFLKNKDIHAVVVLEKKGYEKLGIVPCNMEVFPRMVKIPGYENRYMLVEQMVKRRKKLCPIKLEYSRLMDDAVLNRLGKYLGLKKKQMFHSEAPLDFSLTLAV